MVQATGVQVSVVIPARDVEGTLAEAVESATTQSGVSVEVLVTDDGSTDCTAELCREAAAADSRVRLLSHPGGAHRGVGPSRQLAVDHARGALVAFLDADDAFLPDRLSFQLELFRRHPGAVLVHGGITPIGPDRRLGELMQAWMSIAGVETSYHLWQQPGALRENHIANSTVVVRRAALERITIPRLRYQYEDWGTWLLLARRGPFVFHPRPVTRYRAHPGSFTARHLQAGRRAHLLASMELHQALGEALPRWSLARGRVLAERLRLRAAVRGWLP
jgi:glycosyltransferase involved in cell wall biosynthesis